MRRTALLALLLLGCPSAPVTTPPEPAPDAPLVLGGGDIRPRLEKATLDNGLDVYLLPDAGSPLVCVQVWAKVGSVNEYEGPNGTGITGLSHFFEHLMFQGTTRFPDYDRALAPLGAQNNAFTYQDATVFWAYTPKEHLRHILDIEADRFANMKVDFVHLEPEREVVKSERRQNVDADAGELAEERAIQRTFDVFPYRWGPIGWMSDLDAIPLEAAQRYHAEHYTTRGAYLVIAGDFDPAQALSWVKETWGTLPTPPVKRLPSELLPKVESWVGPRHDHMLRSVASPIVYWSYRAPAPNGATLRDYAALELVDHALTAGKSGRLGKLLVFTDEPKVSEIWARLMPLRFPYAYVWRVDLLEHQSVTQVEALMDAEIKRIADNGLTDEELAQAVASLRADAVRTNLSNSDKAETIGMSIASTGEPFALYDRLTAYPTITQADIKAAVAKYLVPERRVRVVVVAPERIEELAVMLRDLDPTARELAPQLESAAGLFTQALALRAERTEVDREARAIALLKQRGDVATKAATTPEEKAAIKAYLEDNEMGATQRAARLKVQDAALAKKEAELAATQKKLLAAIDKPSKAAPSGRGHQNLKQAIVLLATPLDEQVAGNVPRLLSPDGTIDARAIGEDAHAAGLAVYTIAAFALDARGLAKTAQELREAVLALPLAPELQGDGRALADYARELARDTDVRNVPLVDVPLATLRPTVKKGVAP